MSPVLTEAELEELFSRRKRLLLKLLWHSLKVVAGVVIVSPILEGAYDSPGQWARLICGIVLAGNGVSGANKAEDPRAMKPIDPRLVQEE